MGDADRTAPFSQWNEQSLRIVRLIRERPDARQATPWLLECLNETRTRPHPLARSLGGLRSETRRSRNSRPDETLDGAWRAAVLWAKVFVMEARRGYIQKGVVVLEEPTDVPDGTEVTVIIDGRDEEVHASDEELQVIDAGLVEAQKPERIDARSFLLELRRDR